MTQCTFHIQIVVFFDGLIEGFLKVKRKRSRYTLSRLTRNSNGSGP